MGKTRTRAKARVKASAVRKATTARAAARKDARKAAGKKWRLIEKVPLLRSQSVAMPFLRLALSCRMITSAFSFQRLGPTMVLSHQLGHMLHARVRKQCRW